MIYSRHTELVKNIIDDKELTPGSKTFMIYLLYQADDENSTDMTNEEVAAHFGVTPSTVSKWVTILSKYSYIYNTPVVINHRMRRIITINPDFLYHYSPTPSIKMKPEDEWDSITRHHA